MYRKLLNKLLFDCMSGYIYLFTEINLFFWGGFFKECAYVWVFGNKTLRFGCETAELKSVANICFQLSRFLHLSSAWLVWWAVSQQQPFSCHKNWQEARRGFPLSQNTRAFSDNHKLLWVCVCGSCVFAGYLESHSVCFH